MIDPSLLALLHAYQTDETGHIAGTLIDHLIGTHDLLEAWGASRRLRDAGLFHSIYGTQLFAIQSVPFERRDIIRQAIGDEAERIAFLFSVTDRATYFNQIDTPQPRLYDAVHHQIELITPALLRDLIELEVANLVEFLPRMRMSAAGVDRFSARFEHAAHLISAPGLAAARAAIADQRRAA